MKKLIYLILTLTFFFFQSCSSNFIPFNTEEATIGQPTKLNKELKSLPAPKEKIVAAVYKFRDQTGQYKASATGSSWSTAVTQGTTSILIKALEESGWFVPIEREGLSNLLNERKIIRSSRANYSSQLEEGGDLLPPLLFAGIVLEGGVISYETNLLTGGYGAKYFGIGGSSEYRQDRVTVYLRAISTSNGRILKTVYTSKSLLSQLVDVGLFKFVDVKRLLEVETGYSYNEPPEMCVTEAIEKAVQALIIEGLVDGLWELGDPAEMNSLAVKNYLIEKNEVASQDFFGNSIDEKRRDKVSLGIEIGAQRYEGDFTNTNITSVYGGNINYCFDNYQIGLEASYGKISNKNAFTSELWNLGINGVYYFSPNTSFSPFLKFGGGIIQSDIRLRYKALEEKLLPFVFGSLGVEFLPANFLGLTFEIQNRYVIGDDLDGTESGKLNDYFWDTRFGIKFYPGL